MKLAIGISPVYLCKAVEEIHPRVEFIEKKPFEYLPCVRSNIPTTPASPVSAARTYALISGVPVLSSIPVS